MKKLIIISLAILFSVLGFSQKVAVYETGKEIDKVPRTGMATALQLDKKFVEKMWRKKLKEFGGKMSSSKGAIIIEGASIPSVAKNPVKIIAKIDKAKGGTEAWWAIDLGSSYLAKGGTRWSAAEKILLDFGKKAYIEDINEQIKEAEKAHAKSVKGYEKEISEGENLVKDIEKNESEKIKLEQELVQNGEDLVNLKKDKEQNKKDQEQAKKDSEKMKLAVDAVRAKLDGVK